MRFASVFNSPQGVSSVKVFQRVMLAFVIVASSVVVTGCADDNSASVPAGTLPADAPTSSQDAMKSMGNMSPKGAPGTAKGKTFKK